MAHEQVHEPVHEPVLRKLHEAWEGLVFTTATQRVNQLERAQQEIKVIMRELCTPLSDHVQLLLEETKCLVEGAGASLAVNLEEQQEVRHQLQVQQQQLEQVRAHQEALQLQREQWVAQLGMLQDLVAGLQQPDSPHLALVLTDMTNSRSHFASFLCTENIL